MKILIEESVLRQALSILVGLQYNDDDVELENAITALRSALDAAEKVEPVALDYWHQKDCEYLEQRMKQHPAPAVPEIGEWQLVPKSATIEMIDAGDFREAGNGPELVASIYASMLSAAPTPPTNTDFVVNKNESDTYVAMTFAPVEAKPMYNTEIPDTDSELRQAAQEVVEHWRNGGEGGFEQKIDRLRKTL